MLNKYYYLIASLEYLEFDKAPPVTQSEFLSECRKWLDPDDFQKLAEVNINNIGISPRDPAIIKEWKAFDFTLREDLGGVREMRKKSLHETIPSRFLDLFEEPTPLLMEKRLAKKRWNFIEEKEFGYHFDTNTLILYFLKLQILERLSRFEKEKGKTRFEHLSEATHA